jgi:hypothetical protein
MSEPFDTWRFFFPPRTKMVLPPGPSSARTMWESFPDAIAQYKLKGSRNMTVQHPGGRIELWGRGKAGKPGTIQKQIPLSPLMRLQIESLGLDRSKLHVLDGEFVHAKTTDIKDVLYLFDILVHDSQHLLGVSGRERYDLLHRIALDANIPYFALDKSPRKGMFVAENFSPCRWEDAWRRVQPFDYCEGLVIKRMGPASALEYGGQEYNNSGWMTRLRKPSANYVH